MNDQSSADDIIECCGIYYYMTRMPHGNTYKYIAHIWRHAHMPAVTYTIAKTAAGQAITTSVYEAIATAINQERARRGESNLNLAAPAASSSVTSSYINSLGAPVTNWTGVNYTTVAGTVIQASVINSIIDGIVAAGTNPLVTNFPSSFSVDGVWLVTSYWDIYLYGTYTISGSSASLSGAYTSGATLYSVSPNPAGISQGTNSAGQPAQQFTVQSVFHRGCNRGNQATMWVNTTFKALNTSYEYTSTLTARDQRGC